MSTVKHQPPRQSASAMHRQDKCPSSYARELEYYRWADSMGIAGIVSDQSANRGTDLHAILAKIPFAGRDFGADPFDVRPTVERVAKDLGTPVSGYDAYVLTDMIRKRDDFIEAVIDLHPDGRPAVDTLELFLDERRVMVPLNADGTVMVPRPANPADAPEALSGLGDVIVIARGGGFSVAGILDYKSGQQQYNSADNRQLDSLLALLFTEERAAGRDTLHAALAGIAPEIEAGQPLRIAKYETADLYRVQQWQLKIAMTTTQLAQKMKKEPIEPGAQLQLELDSQAKIGSHCLTCRGKVCCGALKMKASIFEYAITHKYDYLLSDPKLLDPKTVKTETLSSTLALTTAIEQFAALYIKLREEAEMLTIQLHEKGIKVDGAEIKAGRNRIALNETDLKALHAKLGPITGESLEQFAIGVAGKVSAAAVRAHLAGIMGIPETKVVDSLASTLGSDNPLTTKAEKSSVEVTAELADIVQKVEREIAATHAAGAAAPGAATIPTAAASAATAPAPAPKKRRGRKTSETPAVAAEEIVVSEGSGQSPQSEDTVSTQLGCFV